MIKIYYNTEQVGTVSSTQEMWKFIQERLVDTPFEDDYSRCWIDPDDKTKLVIDYGSWSNFFNCYKEDEWNAGKDLFN